VGFITGQIESEKAQASSAQSRRRNLPDGFVTMLMTDIEGSSALLAALGTRYRRLLADVRRELRAVVSKAGGRQVDVRADEFFAVFTEADRALEASVAIQRAVAGRTWPAGAMVRMRTAVHSGEASLTDEGYIGLAVHVTSRLCAAAHGGQILVSGGTRSALTKPSLPEGRLFSLGRYRLRGLPQPEEVFQVEAKGLTRTFPALRASAATRFVAKQPRR
jgi:class 3 adenylate cyclase